MSTVEHDCSTSGGRHGDVAVSGLANAQSLTRHVPATSSRRARGVVGRALLSAVMMSALVTTLSAGMVTPSRAAQPPIRAAHYGTARAVTPRPAAAPFDDGVASIYGVSGTFAAPCRSALCRGAIAIGRVGRTHSSYLRVSFNLNCPGDVPQAPEPIRGNDGTIEEIFGQAVLYNIIPIINVVPRGDCPDGIPLAPDDWRVQLRYLVTIMHDQVWYPASRWVYFEIGNEPNLTPARYGRSYPADFRAAAQGVQSAMGGATKYRVLTAGMLQPTALVTCRTGLPFAATRPTYTNLDMAADAIKSAETGPDGVASAHLGVSVHPYKYNTPEISAYWRNYYYWGNGYAGACFDLNNMIDTWSNRFSRLPIFFTESNWTDQPAAAKHCTEYIACEGTYLVDLFTWLHHHEYDNPRTSPLRVIFFRGADADLSLGLYGAGGADKPFWTGYCPLNRTAYGWKSLATVYTSLLTGPCY